MEYDFASARGAQGFQDESGDNIDNLRNTTDYVAGMGHSLARAGGGLAGQWGQRADQLYGSLAGMAAKKPSWYADRAGVTSNQSFDESKGVLDRTLSRMGINPNSGKFAGLQQQWGLQRAANQAGAMTRASEQADDASFNRTNTVLGAADQGQARGLQLMQGGAGLVAKAGEGYQGLAGMYDTLATGKAQQEGTRKALDDAAFRDIGIKGMENLGSFDIDGWRQANGLAGGANHGTRAPWAGSYIQ